LRVIVSHEQIWAPWRLSYIATPKTEPAGDCFLCRYRDETDDATNLVLWRGDAALTVLNRFPYNNGHLLIAPREHKAELEHLTDAEALECQQQLQRMTVLLKRVLRAEGFNIGLNLGHVAGAGLPGHLHWHVVPRWSGDTNLMPVVGDVKVIPQSLEALYTVLREELSGPPG
jgi:ATP adenylyltransferase